MENKDVVKTTTKDDARALAYRLSQAQLPYWKTDAIKEQWAEDRRIMGSMYD